MFLDELQLPRVQYDIDRDILYKDDKSDNVFIVFLSQEF